MPAAFLAFMGRITRKVAAFAIVAVIVVLSMADDQAPAQTNEDDGLRWDEETGLSQTAAGYPNVAGDDWRGVFYRTDSSSRTSISAVITHDGAGNVTVRTSLSGLGHYLTGEIGRGYSGYVELRERCCSSNDGEIWTTHSRPESNSGYFGFEDYVDLSLIHI